MRREKDSPSFSRRRSGSSTPFKRYESPHFIISLDEKQDGFLSDYLIDTLEKTYQIMAEKYGFQPKEKIRIEIFPDTKAFYYASPFRPETLRSERWASPSSTS